MPAGRPIVDNDDTIRGALESADPSILRTILLQITSEERYLKMRSEHVPFMGGAFTFPVIAAEFGSELREDMFRLLTDYRDKGCAAPPPPQRERLYELMDACAGREMSEAQHEMGSSELGLEDEPRRVRWRVQPDAGTLARFHVLVVGAGLGGIAAGAKLEEMGIPYTLVEKNAGVGGTWWRARYPDARVDVTTHHYSYSFEAHYPWRHHFAPQPELVEYFQHCAEKYGVLSHTRFNTELVDASWNEADELWDVALRTSDGREEAVRANVIISASGLFNRVSKPVFLGMDDFKGKIVHTAEWDDSYDHAGKRIGLIGTGSSGMQTAPRLAKDAAQLTVFQRTPSWVFPLPNYRDAISPELRWLLDHVPYYENWFRFKQFAGYFDRVERQHLVDPSWEEAGSFSEHNAQIRKGLVEFYESKIGHRPDLIAKCVPDYGPLTTRPVFDNGWFDGLLRTNTKLVTEPIERFTAEGIRTADGEDHGFDLIVLASGYRTDEFLWPMHITGRGGLTLSEAWKTDGARAFLGISIPRFPNMFCLYGPNTNPKTGAIFMWEELQIAYALVCIRELIEKGHDSIDVRPEVCDAYNRRMDEKLKTQIWMSGKKSYFRNRFNRVDVNMPWGPDDYYRWISKPDFDNYIFAGNDGRSIETRTGAATVI